TKTFRKPRPRPRRLPKWTRSNRGRMHGLDAIILGHGLAGATLAWHLRWRGWRVLVVDRDEAVTSSKVAAGIVTPVSGRRVARSWRVDEFLPVAGEFYRRT